MVKFNNRDAWQIENDLLRVTVLRGGGHIAELLDKRSGVNPLWIPPWRSIDPADYNLNEDWCYGRNNESRLLSGIMGHNLCLDTFGPPSDEQLRAGISAHGEASIAAYDGKVDGGKLHVSSTLKFSELQVARVICLEEHGIEVRIRESVQNLSSRRRSIAWTQHVSLGPPFLVVGETRLLIHAKRSRVFEGMGFDSGGLVNGADFEWPEAPRIMGGTSDLSRFACNHRSASFTAHLHDTSVNRVCFEAYSPQYQIAFGYRWSPKDFPWIGIWEENKSRTAAPWNRQTVACGMEFGVSPFPETNDQMLKRGQLFGVPISRTLGPGEEVSVEYSAFFLRAKHSQFEQKFSTHRGSN